MQVSITDAGTLRKQLTITYDAAEVGAREQQLLAAYASRMNVKGFRKGKVPANLVKKRYGAAVGNEAREALGNEGLQQAVQEHQLKPIGPIDGQEPPEDADAKGLTVVVAFDVAPEIELPDPKNMSVPSGETGASEEEIEEEVTALCKRAGEHTDVDADSTIEKDDSITLTGKITAGEETVREVHDLNHIVGAYPLFGQEPDQVVALTADKKTGDSLEFDTTLPEAFKPEEWAGKDVQVAVTIQKAQRMQPATLDEEFAKRLGAENVEQLRERITDMISSRKGDELHQQQLEAMVDALIEQTSFELPPKLLGDVTERQLNNAVTQAKGQDADADEDKLREEHQATAAQEAEKELRRHLLMQAIADENNVQATQEDLQQQITMAAYQSGRKPQEIAQQLQESGRIQEVAMDIRNHKALELMLQKILEASGADSGADKAEEATADA